MGELITPRQLVAIRSVANQQRINQEAACAAFFDELVKPEELSRKAASRFIEYLKRED